MKGDTIITLVSPTSQNINDVGDTITSFNKRKVLAGKKSVKQSEFYQAHSNGLKPEITFVVRPFEYKGEEEIEFNSKKYSVLRTYEKNSTELEIVVTGAINGNT